MPAWSEQPIDFDALFEEINQKHFDGFLIAPGLRWNSRLRTSAGRFIPGSRRMFFEFPPIIEIASYLREEGESVQLIWDTMAHEMIHYWLWVRRRPYGHTGEFLNKMREMGVSRYNPVPRRRAVKYLYRCPCCLGQYPARKRLGILACAKCCEAHNHGRYDARFRLELVSKV